MKTPSPPDTETCSTRSAAKMLGVSLRTVQLWVDGGKLDAWKTIGGHRRITIDSVRKLLRERVIAQAPDATRRGNQPKAGTGRTPTVLVVEDDADLLRLYEAEISSWTPPVRLVTACNGFEGILELGRNQPDLLITDLAMPGMDGLEMLRTLDRQGAFRDMRVAVVTGLDRADIELRGGLPDHIILLRKPVPFGRLQAMLPDAAAPAPGP